MLARREAKAYKQFRTVTPTTYSSPGSTISLRTMLPACAYVGHPELHARQFDRGGECKRIEVE
jgi:hypothetical protein